MSPSAMREHQRIAARVLWRVQKTAYGRLGRLVMNFANPDHSSSLDIMTAQVSQRSRERLRSRSVF